MYHELRREAERLTLPDLPTSLNGKRRPRGQDERLVVPICRLYSAPICSPFSATERFMSGTRNTSATARTANSQKSSK